MKRLVIAVTAVVAAGFVILVGLAFLIPADSVRDAVKNEIHAVTGLDPLLRGDVSVSLFPSGAVTFDDVVLGDDRTGQPAVMAQQLKAHLRYFPLLAGRIEIADVTLVRPIIAVNFLPNQQSNWSALIEALSRGLQPNRDRTASFSEIRITDGTVLVRDGNGTDERISNVELSLAWPSISSSFGATGHFVWRDEPVDASVTLTDFLAALSGDRSGVKLRLTSTPLKIAFDGAASYRPTFKVEGTLAADSASLRDAMRWTGGKALPVGGFGRFALKAQTKIGAGVASLSGVNVELDGNTAEGALTLATEGRQTVQGTLASDSLDLTPYISTVRLMATNERNHWDRLPIALEGLNNFDLDLRLSAAAMKIATATLGRTAVVATMRSGRLNVTIGEAQAFGGAIKGSLGVASANGGAEVSSHLQFADVDLNNCLSQLFGLHKIEGRGNLAVNIDGSGASVLALTSNLNGTASLTGINGAITGLNVEQLLRRLERRPLSGSGDFRSGRTPFDQLTVMLKIVQGTVSVDDMHITGPAVKLAVGGQASVPTRELDLKGTATLVSSATANEFELPFVVQGRWEDPIMLPDPQSLIRRSGAAAPLLDAIKDRATSDAVRSAIERFTGGAPAAQAK